MLSPKTTPHRIAIALIAASSLSGCASRPGPAVLETVQALPAASAKQVKVYVVTTRNRTKPDSNIYDTSKAVAANYAELTVSIPPGHQPSAIEWPRHDKPNVKTSFAVVEQSVLDHANFIRQVTMANKGKHQTGVFVHGFNYNFQESVFRLAQMSADTNVGGSSVLFSWPSQGALAGYVADKESATYSRDYLASLMTDLAKNTDSDEVAVFGHSMGGWLVVEALRQLKLQGRDDVLAKLRVILAAPDIDADVFRTQMNVIGKMRHPITILVAPDDRALEVSKLLSASTQRIGTLDVKDPKVEQSALDNGIQIVDISGVKALDSTNHNRFADVAALYPALTANTERSGINKAGAFVFDAAAATISSPFRIVSGVLKQGQ